MLNRILLLVLTMGAIAACTADGVAPTTSQPPDTTTTSSEATTTTAEHVDDQPRWIGISGDRFVDARTGQQFTPVGVNLLFKLGGGGGDRLFSNYDPAWMETQLDEISDLGFNTVRFFLDMCMECTSSESGIRSEYLDDLTDLLTRLERHGLVAMPTSNDVPDPGYSNRLPCCEPFGGYRNSLYLSGEGHAIAVEYWTDLIEGVQERGAPTHHVLGWELANEQFVLRDVAPISMSEGSVTSADGVSYDLSDDPAVTEMVVSNLRAYITTVGDAIRRLDDGALVTMGFFSAEEPGAGRAASDNRWVVPDAILEESTLDFIDLHAYPGFGGTWESIGNAYGLTGESPGYPLLLGEFGAFEQAYPDASGGAAAMARWQAASCDLGFGGWLLWFWGADKDDEVYTADANDAVVASAVSPLVRPDPCDVGPYASDNLALGRPVIASAEESAEYGAAMVVDGSDGTWWSAAEGPPQWVEIDLEEPQTVGRVEILIGHVSPPGPQTHRVRVRGDDESSPGTLVGEVTKDAQQGEVLTIEFDPVESVRYVRVETVAVDGWVILHEIRVFSP
ncbi:MAG: discoidin domain-containing protein [Acidimicrobiia bacterium]